MKVLLRMWAVVVLFGLFGCSGKQSKEVSKEAAKETPKEAVQIILELHKKGDYNTLANERFARIAECKDEGNMKVVLGMFKKLVTNKKKVATGISFYQSALNSDFKIEEDKENKKKGQTGRVAIATVEFKGKKRTMKLYEMENHKWGIQF